MDNKKLKGKLSCVVCHSCKAQRQYDKILIALLLVNKHAWIVCSPTIENVKIVELRPGNNLQCKYRVSHGAFKISITAIFCQIYGPLLKE